MDIDLQYNYPKKGGMNHMARDDEYAGNFLQHGLEKESKDLGVEIITGSKANDLIIEDGVAKGAKVVNRDNNMILMPRLQSLQVVVFHTILNFLKNMPKVQKT